jgi:hypothetical protein
VLDNYYQRSSPRFRPTIPGDATFFNLRVTSVGDPGDQDLAVVVSHASAPARRDIRDSPARIHRLDGESGQERWRTDQVSLSDAGRVVYAPDLRGGSLLVPHIPRERSQRITVIDAAGGAKGEAIEIPAIPRQQRGSPGTIQSHLAVANGQLAIASDVGDVVMAAPNGTVHWSVPAVRNVGVTQGVFTGGAGDDYLLTASANSRFGSEFVRGLILRRGGDGGVAWSQFLDAQTLEERGGYIGVSPYPRANGADDIIAMQRQLRTEDDQGRVHRTALVVLDGEDGTERRRHLVRHRNGDPAEGKSAALVGNVAGDQSMEVLVGGGGAARIIDLSAGETVWRGRYGDPERPGTAGAWLPIESRGVKFVGVGPTGTDDRQGIVAYNREPGEFALLRPQGSGDTLSLETETTFETGDELFDVTPIADTNGDGYTELLLRLQAANGGNFLLYSPGTGEAITEFRQPKEIRVSASGAESANDANTVFAYTMGNNLEALQVIQGSERRFTVKYDESHELRQLGVEKPMPGTAVGDVTGDGAIEVATVTSGKEGGAKLDLRTASSGDVVGTIELEQYEGGRTIPGAYVERIPDQTGDGIPEVGVVAMVGGRDNPALNHYVVDPAAETVLASGDGLVARFLGFENAVGTVGTRAGVDIADVTGGASMRVESSGPPTTLAWDLAAQGDAVSRLYTDGRPFVLTRDQRATVRLPPGEHSVQLRAAPGGGLAVHDTVQVTVGGGSLLGPGLLGATVLAVLGLFVPGIRRRLGW